jgi:phosphoribosylaminoimidazolecarboxamide formyltransferase / IMP cyclohydrolase
MSIIEHVKKVDDLIKLNVVLVSCTNKDGLVSNIDSKDKIIKNIPDIGLLGVIAKINPDVTFISTGGTYKLIKSAGLNVSEVSEVTNFPEMKTGLVKSLHPKIHAGILAHKYTESDDEFMKEQNIKYIDALIVNFYALDKMMEDDKATFEMVRQAIDVGGPTMSHNARKAFISTALITEPENYSMLIEELEKNNGAVSLITRLNLAKKASILITEYLTSVDKVFQNTNYEDLKKCYDIVGGDDE